MNADVTVGNDLMATVGNDLISRAKNNVLVVGEQHVDIISELDMTISAGGEITFQDTTATAANVDEIIKDIVDGKGAKRIRVDSGA